MGQGISEWRRTRGRGNCRRDTRSSGGALRRRNGAEGGRRTFNFGPEALDMLTALSTGHDGSLCTVHAGSPPKALRRIEVLALMSDVGLPHAAIREQFADAFDLVVCQARTPDGTRRIISVAEVTRVAA